MYEPVEPFTTELLTNDREQAYFDRLHYQKYRDKGQNRAQHNTQMSYSMGSDFAHSCRLNEMFCANRFLPAGRIQAALGAKEREVSPFNCSVSMKIEDNIDSIYDAIKQAAKILRLGTGIGYNYSHIRYKGALVRSLQTDASGPLSYMHVFDKSAATIASSGHRRGAQMGILNVDHPDIEAFIDAKLQKGAFEYFNLSVGISDEFMAAVKANQEWCLRFDGKVIKTVSARYLWDKIMRNAFNSAEPGVVFLDRMNKTNNLHYCEEIEATNPCSEQPLPPYGLCTLGSFNLVAYIYHTVDGWRFDHKQYVKDIYDIVEAYDNIFDNAIYAIPQHKEDAIAKRRIGLGLTGIANACELLVGRASYGDPAFNDILDGLAFRLMYFAYKASIELAKKRGPFPLFDPVQYPHSKFVLNLPTDIQDDIVKYGIRNSHLISYAPCGTISQIAGNISSGVEPVFYHDISRKVRMAEGEEVISIKDFAYRQYGFKGRTLAECTVDQHLAVGEICQKYCDSAVSKTVNTPADITYDQYKDIFVRAYDLGMKGCTVYRPAPEVVELRGAVIQDGSKAEVEPSKPVNTSELGTFTCASGACER